MDDSEFGRQCRFEFFKASGHGGQKVNKTSSAVRIIHIPSGIAAVSSESRSQAENRGHALKKIRLAIAMEVRCPEKPEIPDFNMNMSNPRYPLLLALVFDALCDRGFRISEAAASLGLSTGRLVKLLEKNPAAWQKVSHQRKTLGLPPLHVRM